MKTVNENPNGLHQKYVIRKIVGFTNSGKGMRGNFVTKAVDTNAEYFVLRLDSGSKDKKHLEACRTAIHAYAESIKNYLPELSKDLMERYPLK